MCSSGKGFYSLSLCALSDECSYNLTPAIETMENRLGMVKNASSGTSAVIGGDAEAPI